MGNMWDVGVGFWACCVVDLCGRLCGAVEWLGLGIAHLVGARACDCGLSAGANVSAFLLPVNFNPFNKARKSHKALSAAQWPTLSRWTPV